MKSNKEFLKFNKRFSYNNYNYNLFLFKLKQNNLVFKLKRATSSFNYFRIFLKNGTVIICGHSNNIINFKINDSDVKSLNYDDFLNILN